MLQRVEQVRALTHLIRRSGSLIVIVVALVLGLASSALTSRATRIREQDMADPIA